MNILAHLALSGSSSDVRFGNFIGDAVKGRQYLDWEGEIRQGLLLHRYIDSYTDEHKDALAVRRLLATELGLYAPIALDIIFDHVLATEWDDWYRQELKAFTEMCYAELHPRQNEMPADLAYMFSYMHSQDWLWNYRLEDGIRRSLRGLSARVKGNPPLEKAMDLFNSNESTVRQHFREFFSALAPACEQKLLDLASLD